MSGAYQGLYKVCLHPKGDDVYTLFGKTGPHDFIKWVGEMFSIKTPELRRQTIVAAMYGTFEKNEAEARQFWQKVSRGGVEFEDSHPTTVLDALGGSAPATSG